MPRDVQRLAPARPEVLEGRHHPLPRPGPDPPDHRVGELVDGQVVVLEGVADGGDHLVGLRRRQPHVLGERAPPRHRAERSGPAREVLGREQVDRAARPVHPDQAPLLPERPLHVAPRRAGHPTRHRVLGRGLDLGLRTGHRGRRSGGVAMGAGPGRGRGGRGDARGPPPRSPPRCSSGDPRPDQDPQPGRLTPAGESLGWKLSAGPVGATTSFGIRMRRSPRTSLCCAGRADGVAKERPFRRAGAAAQQTWTNQASTAGPTRTWKTPAITRTPPPGGTSTRRSSPAGSVTTNGLRRERTGPTPSAKASPANEVAEEN